MRTSEKFAEVMEKESKRFTEKDGILKGIYSKFSKMGIDIKSSYNLPLKDTIGKTFREQLQFKNI